MGEGTDWGLVNEWWANVYPHVDDHVRFGGKFSRRDECQRFQGSFAAFRIHVRLKPEGAPRRYASEGERILWETDEDWMRGIHRSRSHEVAERMIDRRIAALAPRTLKIEESAS